MNDQKEKTALIFGVTGQDGAYLSRLLVSLGYNVFGTSRDISSNNLWRLHRLGILHSIKVIRLDTFSFQSIYSLILRIKPNEIYNLSGQSSVGLSFSYPLETIESNIIINLNILESIRVLKLPIRFLIAGSSESFGQTETTITEDSLRQPISPYGLAKYSVEKIGNLYRSTYNIFVSTAILFNHESPLRGDAFVTSKIIKTAFDISHGHRNILKLGDINVFRDWGLAEEYVMAMFLILSHETPDDFILATGVSQSLENFVSSCFEYLGINYKNHIEQDESLFRENDPKLIKADITKISEIIGWSPTMKGKDVITHLMNSYKKMYYS